MPRFGKELRSEDCWKITEPEFKQDRAVATGSNFLIGNGYMGYRGTLEESRKSDFVACIVSDTYDNADGHWRELCNVPNPLYVVLSAGGIPVTRQNCSIVDFARSLDMKRALFSRRTIWQNAHNHLVISSERFASMSDIHLLVSKYRIDAMTDVELSMMMGIDADSWSLNGEHLPKKKLSELEGKLIADSFTSQGGIQVVVCEGLLDGDREFLNADLTTSEHMITRSASFSLRKGEHLEFSRVAAVFSTNDVEDPMDNALSAVNDARIKGYDKLKASHENSWKKIWAVSDIRIDGDDIAQTALRFNTYHNIIATPRHTDHLPIGARGLSCQAYQGGAFWDQEIFNLPFFTFIEPDVARKLLIYRYRRLDAARKKAFNLGYRGAFYPWISGDTDEELCPSYFFTDVLTGRRIRNHFNDWQIHVSPDIVYALWQYYVVTGDYDFLERYGAEIAFEVARFLYSFAYFKKVKDRYELIRVLGPDEYHENVDNNAYTNYLSAYATGVALKIYNMLQKHSPKVLEKLIDKLDLTRDEIIGWEEMAEKLYLPQPDSESDLVEQFRGYWDLEDISPGLLQERLIDQDEYWGWPNGIAVETQVMKQADVIQLMFMLPDLFNQRVTKANYDYYEPRTHHRSSLSPSPHSIVASRIGYREEAYRHFMNSLTVDLFDAGTHSSGGTFIGGIHTGACGAAWQMMVLGFAGLRLRQNRVHLFPSLPEHWKMMSFNLVLHGQLLKIDLTSEDISIIAGEMNTEKAVLFVHDDEVVVEPGRKKSLVYEDKESLDFERA